MDASERYERVVAAIDDANVGDPNVVTVGGEERPSELVYSERMTKRLMQFCPDASDELRIAARGQHVRRWTSNRSDYPEGRNGYLRWRADRKRFHAETLAGFMIAAGYHEDSVARVRAIVCKERLKQDPEVQALEDVVCLVFLEHYFAAFAADHPRDKIVDIVRKTWRKMSEKGHKAALQLDLPESAADLVTAALTANAEPA